MENFLKVYLPLLFLGFIILVFIVPSVRVYRQTGIDPFGFVNNNDKVQDYVGASIMIFSLMLFITIVIFSFLGRLYVFLAPFSYLETKTVRITGLILEHLSLIGIMIAQSQMKKSWRIGIDYDNKTTLINNGLFAISRNPIYLFLLTGLIGLFLLIPNAITFAVVFAVYFVLQIEIRLEEGFLLKQHGEAYSEYKKKVRRLV